jgi:crotonobetainyl-CoA:carnitine CoA-transferase CaiB-like acyl-CoA transferase
VFDDPQVQHRHMHRILHRSGVDVPQVANPLRFDGDSSTSDLAPPELGQDSDEILAEMGLTSEDIARLRRAGVVR